MVDKVGVDIDRDQEERRWRIDNTIRTAANKEKPHEDMHE